MLVPRKNPDALAEALSTLINDPARAARMGATGRRLVEQYRWKAVARQVENYYLDCIALNNDGCTG